MGKFIQEFKEFALKGNVMDMAVGIIIGGAFGKIVSSLVNDIIMPPIGLITGSRLLHHRPLYLPPHQGYEQLPQEERRGASSTCPNARRY